MLLVVLCQLIGCAPPPAPPVTAPAPVDDVPAPSEPEEPTAEPEPSKMRVTESGLGIEDLREGQGPEAVDGSNIVVHYLGRLDDGMVFDSSYDRGEPLSFELGSGVMIKGWDEGVPGMRVGGLRKLTIPPHLAYGPSGNPPAIPPDAIVEFEVELLAVE